MFEKIFVFESDSRSDGFEDKHFNKRVACRKRIYKFVISIAFILYSYNLTNFSPKNEGGGYCYLIEIISMWLSRYKNKI